LVDIWNREAIAVLKGAIEKLHRGTEGDFKQALIIADGATETLMRNYLVFKCKEKSPYDYPSLLKKACQEAKVSTEIIEIIEMFRLIRNGFYHQDITQVEKALKGTTTGLTLEKSFLQDYLENVCDLFEKLTGDKIKL